MAITLDQFLNAPPDRTPYHSYPLLPVEGLMIIGAQTKMFKSTLALNIAYDLAEGRPILDCQIYKTPKPLTVLLFEQEIGKYRLLDRLKKINDAKGGNYARFNFYIVSKDLECQFDTPAGLARIEHHIESCKPDVVVYDPLMWFHSQDENSNSALHKITRIIMELNKKHRCSSIVVHHNSKPSEFRSGYNITSLRGGSTVAADADTVLSVEQNKTNKYIIHVNFVLRSAGKPYDEPMTLELNTETLCFSRK